MSLKRAVSLAASAVLLTGLATTPAQAASTAACEMTVGSINANGDRAHAKITASTPPTAEQRTGQHRFSPGAARLSTTWTYTLLNPVGYYDSAYVVLGSSLYQATYGQNTDGTPINTVTRIGGGWDNFIAVEESLYWGPTTRIAKYGLRNDGVLFRWTNGFKQVSSYAGFSAVKTMALMSETATYDTFLATTRGGALYTIRIPVGTAKPVVKQVRASTWQGFEHLVAEKCGSQSTLLTAIDKDTGSAYLYAVGHANGTSTVIKGLGKVPGTYKDPVYNLDTAEGNAPLFGE
ncbi:hypothetical protein ACIBL3_26640 [Kribbella sp. NPDC050124]|uniref:hypothetical protein n=1 Tax=Kribbella sp. NPDC050124 TaxID=3364114 RepID=UPI0037B43E86